MIGIGKVMRVFLSKTVGHKSLLPKYTLVFPVDEVLTCRLVGAVTVSVVRSHGRLICQEICSVLEDRHARIGRIVDLKRLIWNLDIRRGHHRHNNLYLSLKPLHAEAS